MHRLRWAWKRSGSTLGLMITESGSFGSLAIDDVLSALTAWLQLRLRVRAGRDGVGCLGWTFGPSTDMVTASPRQSFIIGLHLS